MMETRGRAASRRVTSFGFVMPLLLALFILLVSVGSLDPNRFQQAAASIKVAFGLPAELVPESLPIPGRGRESPAMTLAYADEVVLIHLVEKLQTLFARMIKDGEAQIMDQEKGFTIRMDSAKLFMRDTNALTEAAREILQPLANLLAGIPNGIIVQGHMDNMPADAGSAYPSNWAIAASQSAAVVNFFATKGGIEAVRLQAHAMGEYTPVASNETEEGRAKNRRIEIIISRQPVAVKAKSEVP